MSIGQLNIYGKDKVEVAIERFQTFEPPEGYFLAFSGGKDSSVIKALADMSGVKYDAKPITMWNLIPKKRMPLTRIVRYCCQELKETSGENRFVVTGVRHCESIKRRSRGGGWNYRTENLASVTGLTQIIQTRN